jgi:hypothetical protein
MLAATLNDKYIFIFKILSVLLNTVRSKIKKIEKAVIDTV